MKSNIIKRPLISLLSIFCCFFLYDLKAQCPTIVYSNSYCEGQWVNITWSNAQALDWQSYPNQDPDGGFYATLADAGVYSYTATCPGNGVVSGSITISINPKPIISITTNSPRCSGDEIHLDLGGTGGTVWNWSGPNGFSSSSQNPIIPSVTTAAAGSYTVTVTSSNGCTATASTLVDVNQTPVANASSNSPICTGESLNLMSDFSDSYQWSGPGFSSNQQNPAITNAQSGTYHLTVSASIGCSSSDSVTVVVNSVPVVDGIQASPVLCFDESTGAINMTISNGTAPYNYQWDPAVSSEEDPEGLPFGQYAVTISDQNNCTASASTTITQPAIPLDAGCSEQSPASNTNSSDGVASIVLTGGTPPYAYDLTGPATATGIAPQFGNYDVNDLSIGGYSLVLTDANNCTAMCSFTINSAACAGFNTISATATAASCSGATDGSIDLTIAGGTLPYIFDWEGSVLDGIEDPSSLSAGTYSVTITDATGCALVEDNIAVGEPDALQFSCTQTSPATNIATNDGIATISIAGGTAPYSYAWNSGTGANPGPGTIGINDLYPGSYNISLTDGNGCIETCSFNIQAANGVDCSYADSITLTKIYYALDGPNWSNNDGWLESGVSINDWHGIATNPSSGCVSVLQLIGNGLSGEIPVEIGDLDSLEVLELQMNDLNGGIPDTIGSLHKLTLINLSETTIVGHIPSSLGNLSNLEGMFLHLNQLDGPIPSSFANLAKLTYLDLDNNFLTGLIPLGITGLTNLVGLELHRNSLVGPIYPAFGELTNLTKLNLSVNNFDGPIPSSLAQLVNLSYLNLSNNNLSGCFPPELEAHCDITYDFTGNPLLPGNGNFLSFCNNGNPSIQISLDTMLCPGDSIAIGGTTYSSTGTYTTSLPAFGGCDSIITLNLGIYTSTTSSFSQTLCSNETVVIGGTVFSQSNPSAQVLLDNAAYNGCDSIVNVNLSFYPPANYNLTQTLCAGTSITVQGTLYSEANPTGTTIIPSGSFHGCDSIVNVNLSFYPPASYNLTQTLCAGTSISVNGTLYNEANPTGTTIIPSGSFHGCDSTVFVNLSFQGSLASFLYPTICQGDFFQVGASVYTQTGSYVDTLASIGNCDSIIYTTLSVVSPSSSNLNATICPEESLIINGTTFNADSPFGSTTLPNASYLGCDSTIVVSLSFFPPSNSDYQLTLCPGESVSVGGQIFDEGSPTGLVTLVGAAENGCDSTIAVALFFENASAAGIDTVLCEGDSLVVNGLAFTTDTDTLLPFGNCDSILPVAIDFLTVEECEELAADAFVISQECKEGIPNVITPSQVDEKNDFFDPIYFLETCTGLNIDENRAELVIINRWGEAVFRRDAGHYTAWDGGKLQQGTYYYYLKIGNKKKTYEIKGAVNLISSN